MATQRRVLKELNDMSEDRASGVHAEPINPANFMHLRGTLRGPPDTPYADGIYHVDIKLPDNYPFVPPKMRFETRVWHPNISSQTGAICLDVLSKTWSPVMTIKSALLSLQSLLAAPEPGDPQDAEVARQMIDRRHEYEKKASEWTAMYASSNVRGGAEVSRERILDGYDEETVGRFTNAGFEERAVVAALKRVGVSRGAGVGEDEAGRVVGVLLGE